MDEKILLRKNLLKVRSEISPILLERFSRSVVGIIAELMDGNHWERVFYYASIRSELNLLSLKELCPGREYLLPRVISWQEKRMSFFPYCDQGELKVNRFGIREPRAQEEVKTTNRDVILVPCVGIDYSGRRLGYGGGFYDRYLRTCTAVKVGVVCSEQIVAHIPGENHDMPMDAWVSENGFIKLR